MAVKMGFDGRWNSPRNVGTKTLGTAWGDIGSAIGVGGANRARYFLSLQIHNGTSVRFRALGLYTSTSSAFGLVALNQSGTGIVTVSGQAYQLASDVDQDVSLPFDLDGCVPYIKLQGQIAAGSATYVSNARLVTSL